MSELFQQFDVWGAFWLTIKLAAFSLAGALVLGTIIAAAVEMTNTGAVHSPPRSRASRAARSAWTPSPPPSPRMP